MSSQVYSLVLRWSWSAKYHTVECFTSDKTVEDFKKALIDLSGPKGSWAFAIEVTTREIEAKEAKGDDNYHYQAYLHMGNTKRRAKAVGAELGKLFPGIEVQPESSNGHCKKAAKAYCVKADHTLHRGPWTSVQEKAKVPDEFKRLVHEPSSAWAIAFFWLIKNRPDLRGRTVNWIFDEEGHSGKTEFVAYLRQEGFGTLSLDNAINMRDQILKMGYKHGYFFDLSRSKDGKTFDMCAVYQVLEELSNGYVRSGKYEGGELLFKPPFVAVMANYMPESDRMTADRIRVYQIDLEDFSLIMPKPVPLWMEKRKAAFKSHLENFKGKPYDPSMAKAYKEQDTAAYRDSFYSSSSSSSSTPPLRLPPSC